MSSTLRDDIRTDLRGLFVGDRTIGDSFLAPIVFVVANAFSGLGVAAGAAVVVGAGVALWRIRRGQKTIYALGGIGAIAFAGFLANRSGRAEAFFLPGIVSAAAWAVVAVMSIVVRRPLAGWSSWLYRQWPREWFWRPDVRPAYTAVTVIWAAYFAVRASLQGVLFIAEQPELLAAAKVVTSWPLIIPLLIASYAYGNKKLHRLGGPSVEEFVAGASPPFQGGQRGF